MQAYLTPLYSDSFEPVQVVQDKNHNYIIAANYSGYSLEIGDTVLYSDFINQNVLVQLTAEGKFIRASNINSSFIDFISSITDIAYDDVNEEILLTLNQWQGSSCDATSKWGGELIVLNSTLMEKKRFNYTGTYCTSKPMLSPLNNHKVMVMLENGGPFKAGNFTTTSELTTDGCFKEKNILLTYDLNMNKLICVSAATPETSFHPQLRSTTKKAVYIGGYKNSNYHLMKYSLDGRIQGEASFDLLNASEEKIKGNFTDNSWLLTGPKFKPNTSFGTYDDYAIYDPIYVVKSVMSEFESAEHWSEVTNITAQDGSDDQLLVFPNPARTHIEVYYRNTEFSVYTLRIVDASGRIVFENISELPYVFIPITDLENGLYLLEISDGTHRKQSKFVKE